MKGHKLHHERDRELGRHDDKKHRATGGRNDAAEDVETKPERYNESRVENEAEERKRGGKAKRHERKRGGEVHEKKHVGLVHGENALHHAGKKPRKNGGRTGADKSPFSSARYGKEPADHKTMDENC